MNVLNAAELDLDVVKMVHFMLGVLYLINSYGAKKLKGTIFQNMLSIFIRFYTQ